MKKINLGCGRRFHKDWTNINFFKSGPNVIEHDLQEGIPFEDNFFDLVYHSHVLEHFGKNDGYKFLEECYRVLNFKGVIRIAVPDLEGIAREYLNTLNKAEAGEPKASEDYNWIILELIDQMTRNVSGGEMMKYLCSGKVPNEDFVVSRIGEEGKIILDGYRKSENKNTVRKSPIRKYFSTAFWKSILMNRIENNASSIYQVGKFRKEGEVHQWMYDKYSLKLLLNDVGFKDVKVRTAFDSYISNWNDYNLDGKDGKIFKPDSLFIEALK